MLHDPDTSDLEWPADSGVQTEPAAVQLHPTQLDANGQPLTMRDLASEADVQAFLERRDAWLQSRVATQAERCPF